MLRKFSILAIGLAIVSSIPAFAQEVSAGVTGRVTDPSGSVIANAAVSMKDKDRGTDWAAKRLRPASSLRRRPPLKPATFSKWSASGDPLAATESIRR